MSGISRIQAGRERRGGFGESNTPGREVWLRDGDQVFLTSVATGEEGDNRLDEIYLYTYNSGGRWVNLLDDPDVNKEGVPENTRSSHKFAFWAYVHEITHEERRHDDWIAVDGPGGRKMYKEEVHDFRIVCLTFGRSDYCWNQLVDVYNDWGGLNNGVMRIKRTGKGMLDTSYAIATTARTDAVPADMLSKQDDLPTIKEYYKARYGGSPELDTPVGVSVGSKEDDLF